MLWRYSYYAVLKQYVRLLGIVVYVYTIHYVLPNTSAQQKSKNSFHQGARLPWCLSSKGWSSGERRCERHGMSWPPWWTRVSWPGGCWAAVTEHSCATLLCCMPRCLSAMPTTGGITFIPRSALRTDRSSHRSVLTEELCLHVTHRYPLTGELGPKRYRL